MNNSAGDLDLDRHYAREIRASTPIKMNGVDIHKQGMTMEHVLI